MTAIVGLRDNSTVWIGADSCGSNGWHREAYLTPKLVRKEITTRANGGAFVLGYTTSFRFGQIIDHHVNPKADLEDTPIDYLVKHLVPEIRKQLDEHGWLKKTNEREDSGTALIAYRGGLFTLQGDLSVLESERWAACGSGTEYALGSLHTSHDQDLDPHVRVENALAAAAAFAPGVMPPFHIEEVPA